VRELSLVKDGLLGLIERQLRGCYSEANLPESMVGHQASSQQQAKRERTNDPRARQPGHRTLRSLNCQIMRNQLRGAGIPENLEGITDPAHREAIRAYINQDGALEPKDVAY
jgi:hypothetical protein